MIIGVDVGPTGTDAVLLDGDGTGGATGGSRALRAVRVPSLPGDAVGSLVAAVEALPREPRARATQLAVGLRVADRALAERAGLAHVGVLRIGGEAADTVRPLFGWPAELRGAVCAGTANVAGGGGLGPHDGAPLDRDAVARFAAELAGRAEAFAVCAVFAPADGTQEREAAEILRAEAGADVPVVLSGEIGSLGLLRRENATVLDAALCLLVARVADELTAALPLLGLAPGAAVLVTRHDGTLMSLDHLRRQPGLSLGSGPACTIRGAGLLGGVRDAVVADIGERRARVGALTAGYPQEAGPGGRIGGVPVSLRVPELLTVDAAAHRDLAEAVDRMQPAAGRLPVVLVGGGAAAVPGRALPGCDVVRPGHGGVAGAFGAAASPVGGHHERIVRAGPGRRLDAVRDEVRDLARAGAVRAGADPRRVRTLLEPDLAVPYLPDALLLRARAFGPPLPL
ncbi:hydantoinase [Streptomyces sp. NBC_00117]|uniref:hydantoinase/oxoprolinase N-terminal domain-containing protein n=1 Tax=unclassified Streptomyces TaxID=2593676 RepID=UPI002E29B629|nr:hydantoinase/oxoprolinase N-terminal domain-containing protein [Streptomyces sp. NBC_01453]